MTNIVTTANTAVADPNDFYAAFLAKQSQQNALKPIGESFNDICRASADGPEVATKFASLLGIVQQTDASVQWKPTLLVKGGFKSDKLRDAMTAHGWDRFFEQVSGAPVGRDTLYFPIFSSASRMFFEQDYKMGCLSIDGVHGSGFGRTMSRGIHKCETCPMYSDAYAAKAKCGSGFDVIFVDSNYTDFYKVHFKTYCIRGAYEPLIEKTQYAGIKFNPARPGSSWIKLGVVEQKTQFGKTSKSKINFQDNPLTAAHATALRQLSIAVTQAHNRAVTRALNGEQNMRSANAGNVQLAPEEQAVIIEQPDGSTFAQM